jgi:AraC-like DNA-binding protein
MLTSLPAAPRRTMVGELPFSKVSAPSAALAPIVDAFMDWDIPDGDTARRLEINVPPSTTPYVIVQYRVPIRSCRQFGDVDYQHPPYQHIATRVHSGVAVIRPSGPVGAMIARLRPEAAARLLGEHLQDFSNAKIGLGDVFDPRDVSLLAEMLSEAPSSRERVACMQHFLLARLCEREPDRIACHAAARLRRNPSLRVSQLAADLGVSERHLSRRFQAMFGTSPKQFARAARVERAVTARSTGSSWADIAYGCCFADQAHMINDFNAIIGVSPDQALRPSGIFAW